jgi:hypothetical protein
MRTRRTRLERRASHQFGRRSRPAPHNHAHERESEGFELDETGFAALRDEADSSREPDIDTVAADMDDEIEFNTTQRARAVLLATRSMMRRSHQPGCTTARSAPPPRVRASDEHDSNVTGTSALRKISARRAAKLRWSRSARSRAVRARLRALLANGTTPRAKPEHCPAHEPRILARRGFARRGRS